MTGKALLWLDDGGATLDEAVRAAAKQYRTRSGEAATLCYVNPAMIAEAGTVAGLRVEPRASIPPRHLLVGKAA